MEDSLIANRELSVYNYFMQGIRASMYIIIEGNSALIIDPNQREDAFALLHDHDVKDVTVYLTHEYFDHISGVNKLRSEFPTHVICSAIAAERITDPTKNLAKFWEITMMDQPEDTWPEWQAVKDENYACRADEIFDGEADWIWHGHRIHAVPAPGHSPGSVLYFFDEFLFSGDSLVNGTGVICRLPGGSWRSYTEKTRPLIEALPDDTMVFPGHEKPDTLGHLRKYLAKFGKVQG